METQWELILKTSNDLSNPTNLIKASIWVFRSPRGIVESPVLASDPRPANPPGSSSKSLWRGFENRLSLHLTHNQPSNLKVSLYGFAEQLIVLRANLCLHFGIFRFDQFKMLSLCLNTGSLHSIQKKANYVAHFTISQPLWPFTPRQAHHMLYKYPCQFLFQ